METHPCIEICSKKEATAKNIFRFLEIRKLTYENKIREAFKKKSLRLVAHQNVLLLRVGEAFAAVKPAS